MICFLVALLLIVSVSSTTVEDAEHVEESEREAKILPIFQVVKFPVSLPEILKDSSVKKLKLINIIEVNLLFGTHGIE